jgi:hypothetical protein
VYTCVVLCISVFTCVYLCCLFCVVCCSVFIVFVIVHCFCYCSLFLLLFISSVVRQMPEYNSQDGARLALTDFPFYVLFSYLCIMRTVCVLVCDVLLPPGVNPTAVKYIISYHIISLGGTSVSYFGGFRIKSRS